MTTCLILTDSNDESFILKHLNKEICSAKFKNYEKQASSTHRELLGVKYDLDSFGEMLRNKSIQININNPSAWRILSVSRAKSHLQNIAIATRWIPREQNELADYYSRIKNTDNSIAI